MLIHTYHQCDRGDFHIYSIILSMVVPDIDVLCRRWCDGEWGHAICVSHIFRLSVSLADWHYHQIAMKQCECVFTQPHSVLCIPICISFEIYVALDSCMRFQPLKIHASHFVCFFAPIYCVLNLLFAPLSNETYVFFCLPPLPPPPTVLFIFHHAVYTPSYISFRWLQSQRL